MSDIGYICSSCSKQWGNWACDSYRETTFCDKCHIGKANLETVNALYDLTVENSRLRELEELCITFISYLERGDEYDHQVEAIRDWICDKYPAVIGGGMP